MDYISLLALPITGGNITLIMVLLLVVAIITGFLSGLWKGFKKTGIRFAFFITAIILSGILTPVFSSLAMQIKISGQSLNNYFLNMLIQLSPQVGTLLSGSSTLSSLVEQLPVLLMNAVMFILSTLILSFIFWIGYLITMGIIKRKKIHENITLKDGSAVVVEQNVLKPKKRRLLGALVGTVQSVLFLFVFLIPISGLVSTVLSLSTPTETVVSGGEKTGTGLNIKYNNAVLVAQPSSALPASTAEMINSIVPADVMELFKSYNNSITAKLFNVFGLTNATFDTIATTKIEGQKICLRTELIAFGKAYDSVAPIILKISGITGVSFVDMDFVAIQNLVKELFSGSGIIKIVLPDLMEYGISYLNTNWATIYTGKYATELGKIVSDLATKISKDSTFLLNISKDTTSLIDSLAAVQKSQVLDAINNTQGTVIEKANRILEKLSKYPNTSVIDYQPVRDIMQGITSAGIFKTILVDAVNIALPNIVEPALQTFLKQETPLKLGQISADKIAWGTINTNIAKIAKCLNESLKEITPTAYDAISKDFLNIVNYDYIKIVNNAFVSFDTIKNGTILKSFVNNGAFYDVFGELVNAFSKTTYGSYFDLNKINSFNFVDKAPLVVVFLDCLQQYNKFVDNDVKTVPNWEAVKNNVIAIFNDDAIISGIKPYVIQMIEDKINTLTSSLSATLAPVKTAITELFAKIKTEGLYTETSLLSKIVPDLKVLLQIAVQVLPEDSSLLNFEGIKTQLTKPVQGNLQTKAYENIIDTIFENQILGNLIISLVNSNKSVIADQLKSKVTTSNPVEISPVFSELSTKLTAENLTTTGKQIATGVKSIAKLALESMQKNVNPLDNIEITLGGVKTVIDFNIKDFLSQLGVTLQTLLTNPIFAKAGGGSIFDEIITALNASKYGDFIQIDNYKSENFFTTEFTRLSNIISGLKTSGTLNDVLNFETANLKLLLSKFSTKGDGNDVDLIFGELISSKLMNKLFMQIVDKVNDTISTSLALTTKIETPKITYENLTKLEHKAEILNVFKTAIELLKKGDLSFDIKTFDAEKSGEFLNSLQANSSAGDLFEPTFISIKNYLKTSQPKLEKLLNFYNSNVSPNWMKLATFAKDFLNFDLTKNNLSIEVGSLGYNFAKLLQEMKSNDATYYDLGIIMVEIINEFKGEITVANGLEKLATLKNLGVFKDKNQDNGKKIDDVFTLLESLAEKPDLLKLIGLDYTSIANSSKEIGPAKQIIDNKTSTADQKLGALITVANAFAKSPDIITLLKSFKVFDQNFASITDFAGVRDCVTVIKTQKAIIDNATSTQTQKLEALIAIADEFSKPTSTETKNLLTTYGAMGDFASITDFAGVRDCVTAIKTQKAIIDNATSTQTQKLEAVDLIITSLISSTDTLTLFGNCNVKFEVANDLKEPIKAKINEKTATEDVKQKLKVLFNV
ncbi:MAG: hypothetical protein RR140_01490 [Clostridia bacterium]